jgi:hypothetical protein
MFSLTMLLGAGALLLIIFAALICYHEKKESEDLFPIGTTTVQQPINYRSIRDVMVLKRIEAAASFDDLLAVVETYDSSEFTDEEAHRFIEKGAELGLSQADWDRILDVTESDGGSVSEGVRQRADESFRRKFTR